MIHVTAAFDSIYLYKPVSVCICYEKIMYLKNRVFLGRVKNSKA